MAVVGGELEGLWGEGGGVGGEQTQQRRGAAQAAPPLPPRPEVGVSLLLFHTAIGHSVMGSASSTCISPVWLERCNLSLSRFF